MKPDLELVAGIVERIVQSLDARVSVPHGAMAFSSRIRNTFGDRYNRHVFRRRFIGKFAPGNLVMTGPNLPHNWVSDLAKDVVIDRRCIILQFSEEFITNLVAALPELHPFLDLLADSRRGVQFSSGIAEQAQRLLSELLDARGATRIQLFMALVDLLIGSSNRQVLASESYHPDPLGYMSANINRALVFIGDHLTDSFSEADLARFTKQSPSAFSRSFRRAHRIYLRSIRQSTSYQCRLPDADEFGADARDRYLLWGRLQQYLELQQAVPRPEGHVAQ